jgi:hypothetical protein
MYQATDVLRYQKPTWIDSFRLARRINPISSDNKHLIIDTTTPQDTSTSTPEFSPGSSVSDIESQQLKIQTCPNLGFLTPDISSTSIELCQKTNHMARVAIKGQVQLKRAATWLGLASQKLLTSPNVLGQFKKLTWPTEQVEEMVYGTDADHVIYLQ